MSDLLDKIRFAQIEAGERVVMDDLRQRGLTDGYRNPADELAAEVEAAKAKDFAGMMVVTMTVSEANRRMIADALRHYAKHAISN